MPFHKPILGSGDDIGGELRSRIWLQRDTFCAFFANSKPTVQFKQAWSRVEFILPAHNCKFDAGYFSLVNIGGRRNISRMTKPDQNCRPLMPGCIYLGGYCSGRPFQTH